MNKSRIAAYCMCGAFSASLLSGCSMNSLGGLMGKPPTVSEIVSSWPFIDFCSLTMFSIKSSQPRILRLGVCFYCIIS